MSSRVPLPEVDEWFRAHGLWNDYHCCLPGCTGKVEGVQSRPARCQNCGSFDSMVESAPQVATAPYVRDSPTSKAAAKSIEHRMNSDAERVFDFIAGKGAYGATCDWTEHELGMSHQTTSARIRQLLDEGRLTRTARARPTRSGRSASVLVTT